MIACASCGFEAADDFAFCPRCGAALAAPPAAIDERKVVTTLFCDLVGFTAMSETADPEDVDAVLRALPRRRAQGDRVARRHGREVHR